MCYNLSKNSNDLELQHQYACTLGGIYVILLFYILIVKLNIRHTVNFLLPLIYLLHHIAVAWTTCNIFEFGVCVYIRILIPIKIFFEYVIRLVRCVWYCFISSTFLLICPKINHYIVFCLNDELRKIFLVFYSF